MDARLPFALSMQPIDWGLMGASVVLVISAARTFATGKGKAGMGLGSMIIASAVFTFAIGRQLADISVLDGIRLALGVLLLVPVVKAIVGKGGTTSAVVGLLLASVSAGPIIARAFPEHVETDTPYQITRVEQQIDAVDGKIEVKQAVWERLISELSQERAALEALNIGSTDDLAANPAALQRAQRFAKLDAETAAYRDQIDELKREKANLESTLDLLERTGGKEAIDEAEAVLKRVDGSIERFDQTVVEQEIDRARALEVFQEEFLGSSD